MAVCRLYTSQSVLCFSAQRAVTTLAGGVNHRDGIGHVIRGPKGRHIRKLSLCVGPSGLMNILPYLRCLTAPARDVPALRAYLCTNNRMAV